MIKAVLFDLDNTLILFDEAYYFKNYIHKISLAFEDIMPIQLFQQRLIGATQALIQNDGKIPNAEFYMREFCRGFEHKRAELWQRFETFYETQYDQFRELVVLPDGVRIVLDQLQALQLTLVIASNPMFPLSIQLKRLSWAGLDHIDFALITHIGNMSFCKPRLEYYQEICTKINEKPEDCLMVGNDPLNDMIVSKIGMKTYLTVDGEELDKSNLALSKKLRNHVKIDLPKPDFSGPLLRLPDAVRSLLFDRTHA